MGEIDNQLRTRGGSCLFKIRVLEGGNARKFFKTCFSQVLEIDAGNHADCPEFKVFVSRCTTTSDDDADGGRRRRRRRATSTSDVDERRRRRRWRASTSTSPLTPTPDVDAQRRRRGLTASSSPDVASSSSPDVAVVGRRPATGAAERSRGVVGSTSTSTCHWPTSTSTFLGRSAPTVRTASTATARRPRRRRGRRRPRRRRRFVVVVVDVGRRRIPTRRRSLAVRSPTPSPSSVVEHRRASSRVVVGLDPDRNPNACIGESPSPIHMCR